MKHISGSSSPATAQTLSACRDTSKNAEKAQTESTAGGTSSNRSDVTVSRQAYSQAKFESYETMDRNALKKRGIELLDQLYIAGSKKANAEVPNSDDPARLARAKQATVFCQKPSNDSANPFLGLPREELTKIIYDDSGTYTINERSAALSEQQRQHYNYWSPIIDDAFISGDYRKLYRTAIDFHDKLSPIEKSFAPEGYRENVVNWLKKEEDRLGKLGDISAAPFLNDMAKNSLSLSSQAFSGVEGLYGWMDTIVRAEQAAATFIVPPSVEKGKELTHSIFRVTWNSVTQPIKNIFQ